MKQKYVSLFSHLYHFLVYSIKKPAMQLETGMFIISIDVDVGSRELGIINGGKNDANVSSHSSEYQIGKIEETALPLFIEHFNDFELPVTLAIRGQLTEVEDSIPKLLQGSSVNHDIGAHGYSHRKFTDLSRDEAENELKRISMGMKKFGIIPKSFVFPKNRVAHLDLLEKFDYKCYRSHSGFMNDSMNIKKRDNMYNMYSSLFIDQYTRYPVFCKILDIATSKKLPFHMWFHPWNFGESKETIEKTFNKVFAPLLKYAKTKEKNGTLTFETMLSAANKVEASLPTN